MSKRKAGPCGEGPAEPQTPSTGEMMTTPTVPQIETRVESGPYKGYRVVVSWDEHPVDCHLDVTPERKPMRVYYRVSLVPSRQLFTVRFLRGATDDEKLHTLSLAPRIAALWATAERRGAVEERRYLHDTTKPLYFILGGQYVDDPLIQLELEMIIDSAREAAYCA